jgi:long-chain acyl-CoA synthetase
MITSAELDARVAGQTVTSRFADTVRAHPDLVALRAKDGDGWIEITYAEFANRACRLAGSLADLGVGHGDRVALMLRNRPEFSIADLGVLLVGATPVSIYNSSAPDQIQYLMSHCEAKVAIIDDISYLERVLKVRDELPGLGHIAIVDDPEGLAPDYVGSWGSLVGHEPVDLATAVQTARPEDLATIIYTSGTTGPPKGVMLDHSNIVWTCESLTETLTEIVRPKVRMISYLPMAHIAERLTSHYQGIFQAFEVTSCPEANQIASYLPQVRPQLFFAVPRIWEKIYAAVQARVGAELGNAAAFEQALEVGVKAAEYRAKEQVLPSEFAPIYEKVETKALRPVRELLGVDAIEIAITGAAPIPIEVLGFFRALGVPLAEIYGLSETSGPMTFDAIRVKLGTVGRGIPGCEVALADDGEVICRGGNVFRGYLNTPEKTAEVLDADGWFHSGDIGVLDDEGYLKIVDRKKELIITAGGKNISPANLEAALKSFPLIGQACVIGDQKPFISALVVLDPDVAPVWARERGIEETVLGELADHPEVLSEVERCIAEANKQFSKVEQVKKFTLLGEEWMPDTELLTPTMKLKRRGVLTHYSVEIETMYQR